MLRPIVLLLLLVTFLVIVSQSEARRSKLSTARSHQAHSLGRGALHQRVLETQIDREQRQRQRNNNRGQRNQEHEQWSPGSRDNEERYDNIEKKYYHWNLRDSRWE
jgi:Ni/Co efflux regulator RcnB